MVVHYASGGEGSWTSIFTTLPRILIKMEGSVLPHITPQLLIVAGLGVLSIFWNPLRGESGDESLKLQPAMSVRAHREDGLPVQYSCLVQQPMLILYMYAATTCALLAYPMLCVPGQRDSAVFSHGV